MSWPASCASLLHTTPPASPWDDSRASGTAGNRFIDQTSTMTPAFVKKNRILSHFTPRLAAAVGLIALSSLNYGFDNQGIATSQAMTTYKKQFGTYDPTTNTYAIPTYWTSLLNSLNFIGFACGALFSCSLFDFFLFIVSSTGVLICI
jgi:hypothetical protein